MNAPLRIAFLWHNHQPFYEKEGELILPWVRMHAVKDYLDIPLLMNEFPDIIQNFNIVPSLFLQLFNYQQNKNYDIIQRLTNIPAEQLIDSEKSQIIKYFFLCNADNLIKPNQRYQELYEKSKIVNPIYAFTIEDWRDLQVWYNLAWLGPISKKDSFAKRLIAKSKNFTEEDKYVLLDLHSELIAKISQTLKRLIQLNQAEVSVSPFYHPILPLLIDSDSSKQANPENTSVEPIFAYPEDAKKQINDAVDFYQKTFGNKPNGMWPSEGSVSNEAIELIADSGIKWIATDEGILAASEESTDDKFSKFFPRKFKSNRKELVMFFRDHILSDKIGFEYSRWNPHDAARDFVNILLSIKSGIFARYGESGLKNAAVPIILDGENCWEYYPNNGYDFLKALFSYITITPELKTIRFIDAVEDNSSNFQSPLRNIRAGSWIDANFNIWIKDDINIKAWSMLSIARKLFEELKPQLSDDTITQITNEFMIAEGSDWFWWYYPNHIAENKSDFDVLFRWRLARIYNMLGKEIPKEILTSLSMDSSANLLMPKAKITPKIDGIIDDDGTWNNAGRVILQKQFSTMHQNIGEETTIYFGNDSDFIYFRIDNFQNRIRECIIQIELNDSNAVIQFGMSGISIKQSDPDEVNYSFALSQIAEIKLPLSKVNQSQENSISIRFKTINLITSTEVKQDLIYNFL